MPNIKLIFTGIILFCLSINPILAQVESEKDSLESLLPFAKDYQRADIFIALADLIKHSDTTEAVNYSKQALKISNALSYHKGMAGSNIILGFVERNRGNYASAKTKYLYAISFALKSKDPSTLSWAYQNMGNLYFIQSDFTMAMRYYLGALSNGEKAGNAKRIALAYNQIGSVCTSINDTTNATNFYNKAFVILRNLNDEIAYARVSNNLGNIYKNKSDFTKALYHYSQSLEVFRKHELNNDISTVLNNIGSIYLAQNNVKKGFAFLYESYHMDKLINDKHSIVTSSLNLSTAYLDLNKLDSALYFGQNSLNQAKLYNLPIEYADACKQLSKVYKAKGDSEKAFYYLKESTDSQILDAKKGAEIEGVRSGFESAKKDEVLNKLDNENKVQRINITENEISIQKKNAILLGLFCVIVFLVLLVLLVFYFLTQKRKRKTLELSSAAKTNILQRINHELRTPLNSLINYSYLANDSKNLNELREYLSGINASGNDLMFSMNNIVSYLQIDAKNDLVINESFNLLETLQPVFLAFQIQCNQKGILFSQLISPDIPAYVISDKSKIVTIVQNLLNNALKFSESGVIKIEIKQISTSNVQELSKSELVITITDEGQGLKGKNIKDLVLTNSKKANENGFGLGLFVVKTYVGNLNGFFELTNNEQIGCKALVSFTLQVDNSKTTETKQLLGVRNTAKLSILLVEDDLTNSITLHKILERKGHKVTPVFKGKDVFTELVSKHFDLVLVDIDLPDMSGLELARFIRMGGEFSSEKDIPIIALSANADPLEMQQCVQVGINEYLTKPLNKEFLLQKIQELTVVYSESLSYANS
jgi:signal transduction histidine kinase/CheY-like chemotaxis protein/lipopolysaccharide biosynthesis regulator YciM